MADPTTSPHTLALKAFGGRLPRIYNRLLRGDRRAWGRSARQARQEVLDTLARVGLTIKLIARPCGVGRYVSFIYQVGMLVEI